VKLTQDSEVVDDLIQDLFVKVYRNKKKLSGISVHKYLMTGATNIARDYLRKIKRRTFVEEVNWIDCETPEDWYAVTERLEFYRTEIKPRIEALPEPQKQAVLAYANARNLAREARNLGIAYTTFKSRRNTGLNKLRGELLREH